MIVTHYLNGLCPQWFDRFVAFDIYHISLLAILQIRYYVTLDPNVILDSNDR